MVEKRFLRSSEVICSVRCFCEIEEVGHISESSSAKWCGAQIKVCGIVKKVITAYIDFSLDFFFLRVTLFE